MERTYEEIIEIHNFSVKDINCLKHALGIDKNSIRNGKCICYRNYFNTGINNSDYRIWEYLVFVGFANMYSKELFTVTKNGIKFLEDILSVKIEIY